MTRMQTTLAAGLLTLLPCAGQEHATLNYQGRLNDAGRSADGLIRAISPPAVKLADKPVRPAADQAPDGLSARDWSNIRQQSEQHRHAVRSVDGGHQARNPGQ